MLQSDSQIEQQESGILGYLFCRSDELEAECQTKGFIDCSIEQVMPETGRPNTVNFREIPEPCGWIVHGCAAVRQEVLVRPLTLVGAPIQLPTEEVQIHGAIAS